MDRPDRDALDDATWDEAVTREVVIRKLLAGDRMERGDFYRACRDLGVKRSRLYELIRAYKAHPVTSSLVVQPAGMKSGSRRLPQETDAVITEVINTFYKSRQKPNITGLHKEIRRLCLLRNLHVPSWYVVRSRIEELDPAELAAAREGAKAVRDRYRPEIGRASCRERVLRLV